MKGKKFLALTMAVAMALLSGCGSGDGNASQSADIAESTASESAVSESASSESADAGSASDEAVVEDPFAENVKLTWLGYYPNNVPGTEDTWAERLIEDTFNVDITPVTDVTPDNSGVWISSGSVLDTNVVCSQVMSDGDEKMYEQGLIREFPEEWLWEYYPTGMKALEEILGADYFEKGYHLLDGKCVHVPFNNGLVNSTPVLLYRKDWMENLNLSEPTTLEELHDLLYAFTYDDPDGNGKDDTYGMHGLSLDRFVSNIYWVIFSPYIGSCQPLQYIQAEDGSVYYVAASEPYREALRVLKEWYDEGILDPECITDNRAVQRTKWSNGQFGVLAEALDQTRSLQGPAGVISMVESVYGEDTIAVMHPLTTDKGDGVVYTGTNGPNDTLALAWYFTADTTDEQIIRTLQILEGILNDEELYIKIYFGEEGVDYVRNEDGSIQSLDHVTTEYKSSKGIGNSWLGGVTLTTELRNLQMSERDKQNYEIGQSWPKKYYNTRNIITGKENNADKVYGGEVWKIATEYYCNVLLGTDNLDEGWDAYLDRLSRAGMDDIIAEYEEMLK